jgi:hypothetical protein
LNSYRAWIGGLIAVLALSFVDVAICKEFRTTACGRDRCRTVANGIARIATLPGRVPAPRAGRFYTVSLRPKTIGWTVVYEERRQIVRAADRGAASFLGRGWARLTVDTRVQFARAVRGLAPMRATPPYGG